MSEKYLPSKGHLKQEKSNFLSVLRRLREKNAQPEKKYIAIVKKLGQQIGILLEFDEKGYYHVLTLPIFKQRISTPEGMKVFADLLGHLIYFFLNREDEKQYSVTDAILGVVDRLMDSYGETVPFYQIIYHDGTHPTYTRRYMAGTDDLGTIDVSLRPDHFKRVQKLFTPRPDTAQND